MNELSEWTLEWPDEPGQYLFYGHRKSDPDRKFRLRLVRVEMGSNSIFRATEGEFFYPSEQYGWFRRVDLVYPEI